MFPCFLSSSCGHGHHQPNGRIAFLWVALCDFLIRHTLFTIVGVQLADNFLNSWI